MKNPVNELSNAQVRSHVELLQRNCFQKEAREKFSNAYSAGKSKQKKLPMKVIMIYISNYLMETFWLEFLFYIA